MTPRAAAVVLASLCAAALAVSAAATPPGALAASKCAIAHHGEHFGPTYLTALDVSATTCATGFKVVRAYHRCQLRKGGVTARCSTLVDGFRCQETRGPSISTEFYSRVACRRRHAKVSYKYEQFT
jgi:hypothetical protein